MVAIALALGAAAAWGAGDFLGGSSARRLPTLAVLGVSQLAGLVLVAAFVLLSGTPLPGGGALLAAALAGAAGAAGLAALYRGLAIGAMGVVAPISATAAIIPFAVGVARGERPGTLASLGALLALAGVVLASRERSHVGTRLAAGVGLALVAACGFGGFIVAIDVAAEESVGWAITVARSVATALALAALAVTRTSLRGARASLPVLVAIGALDMSANALLGLATTKGLLGIVAVLSSLYPVVTILLARAVLGERLQPAQGTGAIVALTGVALVSAGS